MKKPKLDTWINFKTTKEQKAEIELWADRIEISQSELIRAAIDHSIMTCVLKHLCASQELRGIREKTYNFALTESEIKLLIMATSHVTDSDARKLHGIFVRALESIESGSNMKREETNNVQA